MMSTIKIMGGDVMQVLEISSDKVNQEMKKDKLVIRIIVYSTKRGSYKLEMYATANDGFTDKIFVKDNYYDEYEVRKINTNDCYIHEKIYSDDNKKITNQFFYEAETLEEIFNKMHEVLRYVKESRERVRAKNYYKEFTALV